MKFFVDTANIKEIEELIPTGFVDGVTTNPSLIAKNGDDMGKTIKAICSIVSGPVSAEVTAIDFDTMLKEGEYLASLAKNIAVKVPLTPNGLKTCKALREKNIMVNVTLCFSAAQALLAAKAGATYISPFVGRVEDNSFDGVAVVKEIASLYAKQNIKMQYHGVLSLSIEPTLKRGFVLTQSKGKYITSAKAAKTCRQLTLNYHDGKIQTEITHE